MNQKKASPSPTDGMMEWQETLQKLFLSPTSDVDRITDEQKRNIEYLNRINEVAVRGAHTLVTRQGVALRETFDELSLVMKDAAGKAGNPATPDAQLRCIELSVAQGLEHMRIAFDWTYEMNRWTWDLFKDRLETSLGEAKSGETKLAGEKPEKTG